MKTYNATPRAREAADQIEMLMAVEGQPVHVIVHDTGRAIEIVVPADVPDKLRASPHVPASMAVGLATHARYVQWARRPSTSLFVLCDDQETFEQYDQMLNPPQPSDD
jgi:D-serine deaminase-like pyridoxal phosphate-dependent protein